MKKRRILNLLMVVIIILTALCGVMTVGSIKGWFGKEVPVEGTLMISGKTGIATVERNGIAYELESNSTLRNYDVLRTKVSSEILVSDSARERLSIGANSKAQIMMLEGNTEIQISQGETFVDGREISYPFTLNVDEVAIIGENAVYTVSVQAGTTTVYVYSGNITLESDELDEVKQAVAGETISVIKDSSNNVTVSISKFKAEALNEYQIKKLQNCSDKSGFYFSSEDLDNVIKTRQQEKEKAQQEQLLLAQQAKEKLKKEQEKYEKAKQEQQKQQQNYNDKNSNQNTDASINANVWVEEEIPSFSTNTKYCTIEIRCDEILNNMGNLTPGKEAYVPSNGVILATSSVEFTEGETVFDIIQRTCSTLGIHLEYSFTPMYDSYYIEGINNLYEKDCGSLSGWLYKVNGWFPNYGCSKYTVAEGDTIVWTYTCNGFS